MASAEIIAIGNEILRGDVLDTNSHWLCGRLGARGAAVGRITVLPDVEETIADALRGALGRGPRLVVTTGGLGPTEDDRTLAAVARALGRDLRRDETAHGWVRETYRRLAAQGYVDAPDMTPARAKMARLPAGAEPLHNGVGTAPGVVVREGAVTIACLPGVPEELKGIFEGPLRAHLVELFGEAITLTWRAAVSSGDESELAPILQQVAGRHPDVYLKSRARGFGPERRFLVTLSARGEGEGAARERLQRAWDDLEAALTRVGIPVLSRPGGDADGGSEAP